MLYLIQMPRRRWWKRQIEWTIHPDDYELHPTVDAAVASASFSHPHWRTITHHRGMERSFHIARRIDGVVLWRIVGMEVRS
jgi:hypothetical protein